MAKNQPGPQDDKLSVFELIEKAVDAAMQAEGIWTPEISDTVGEIVKVAEEVAKQSPAKQGRGIYDAKKIMLVDSEAMFVALAIYKQVVCSWLGISESELDRKISQYMDKRRA